MRISAFTIIKNSEKYQFPIIESISSLLPFVDEFIVNIGKSEDNTLGMLSNNFAGNFKVKMFLSEWAGKEKGTQFISEETNKALEKCEGDWVFYLQADEVVNFTKDYLDYWIDLAEEQDKLGITLKYLHFAGDENHIFKDYKDGYDHYDKELRIFRNTGELASFGDGQSFSSLTNGYFDPRGPQPVLHQKERFLDSDMEIFHYSYLRDKKILLDKKKYLQECYNVSEPSRMEKIMEGNGEYIIDPSELKEFKGKHPEIMKRYLERLK